MHLHHGNLTSPAIWIMTMSRTLHDTTSQWSQGGHSLNKMACNGKISQPDCNAGHCKFGPLGSIPSSVTRFFFYPLCLMYLHFTTAIRAQAIVAQRCMVRNHSNLWSALRLLSKKYSVILSWFEREKFRCGGNWEIGCRSQIWKKRKKKLCLSICIVNITISIRAVGSDSPVPCKLSNQWPQCKEGNTPYCSDCFCCMAVNHRKKAEDNGDLGPYIRKPSLPIPSPGIQDTLKICKSTSL